MSSSSTTTSSSTPIVTLSDVFSKEFAELDSELSPSIVAEIAQAKRDLDNRIPQLAKSLEQWKALDTERVAKQQQLHTQLDRLLGQLNQQTQRLQQQVQQQQRIGGGGDAHALALRFRRAVHNLAQDCTALALP